MVNSVEDQIRQKRSSGIRPTSSRISKSISRHRYKAFTIIYKEIKVFTIPQPRTAYCQFILLSQRVFSSTKRADTAPKESKKNLEVAALRQTCVFVGLSMCAGCNRSDIYGTPITSTRGTDAGRIAGNSIHRTRSVANSTAGSQEVFARADLCVFNKTGQYRHYGRIRPLLPNFSGQTTTQIGTQLDVTESPDDGRALTLPGQAPRWP